MTKTSAIFFDGISSTPQKVELLLNELHAQLVIHVADNKTIQWAFEEISFEQNGNMLVIQLKSHSLSSLKIEDSFFISAFYKQLKQNRQLSWYHHFLKAGRKTHVLVALFILAVVIAAYFTIIPWIAESAVNIIPEKYDDSLGNTFFAQYLNENEIDSAKTETLNLFASELKLNNSQPIHLTVVKSSTVNAFALPNGQIIVYTGLLHKMKNYDELGGLIGHEVIHINNRHTMKMLCRNLSGYIFISMIFSDVNGIMSVIANNAQNLQSLSFSRKFEEEADKQGTELMIQNEIDPQGMVHLFLRLKDDEKVTLPEFMNSHPITDNRIKYIKEFIQEKQVHFTPSPYLQQLFSQLKNNETQD